jgi:branched-subunit amino acid transport protein
MSAVWLTVLVVGLASITLKAAGPVLLGGRELPPRARRLVEFIAPTVLAALIATQLFASGRRVVVDERAIGLVAAVAMLKLKAPTLVVVVVAAASTAAARALV